MYIEDHLKELLQILIHYVMLKSNTTATTLSFGYISKIIAYLVNYEPKNLIPKAALTHFDLRKYVIVHSPAKAEESPDKLGAVEIE